MVAGKTDLSKGLTGGQIFAALPTLSQPVLRQLQQRVSLLLDKSFDSADQDEWLLEGIVVGLREQGIWSGKFQRTSLPKNFEALQAQQDWLIKGCLVKPTPHEQFLLAKISSEVLVTHLRRIKLTPSLKLVLQNLYNLPIAFEYAYPGYWECKVLLCLVPTKSQRK